MTQQTSLLASRVGAGRADGGRRWRSVDPAHTGQVVAEVMLAEPATFVAAARAARAAQPGWAATPAPVRGRMVKYLGRLVEENREALARLVTREIGKPLAEARGEVQEIIDTCDFFAGEGRRLYGQTVASEMPDKQLFTFRQPVGVAAVVTAGNFPVAVPSWYLVPALLCGNAVVRRIGELCGRHLQVPCLELGGKNPLVVMPDADLDLAVEGALFSGFGTAGQRCTSLGTVIVHQSVHDEFVSRFTRVVEESPIGDPTQDVLYGPMLSERFHERFLAWLDLIQEHHTVHGSSGMGRISADNPREGFVGEPEAGIYDHPTIVDRVTMEDEIYRTETFGPIVGVASFSDFDEAVALSNGHGYGLSAAIYTTDATNALRFRERNGAGMLSVNNSTSGAEAHLPFGGNGKSGNGSRLSGIWVLDQFTRWQSMNWDYAGK